ncbi:hypothetical protein JAAARDRAFT_114950, partial [Jaapia argillacea MUCL 33604]
PTLHIKDKSLRGFSHPTCGMLLCSVDFDWGEAKVRDSLHNGDPAYPTGPDHWPRFLWRDEIFNESDTDKGFLRSDLLVKAVTHILIGPSTATSKNGLHSTHKGKAASHKIKSITVAAIAYAAVLVHFALSSQPVFSPDGGQLGKFNYEKFYNNIIRSTEVMDDVVQGNLLSWWN